jgi:hypothetical protein
MQEIMALRRLADHNCQSAPQLLDYLELLKRPGMHGEGIVGGYVVITLMTKVSGSALPWNSFYRFSRAERNEFREAFNKALM